MSAGTRTGAPELPARVAPESEPPARFRDLVAAEWLKLWSLRSTPWLLALIAVAVVAVNANGAATESANFHSSGGAPDPFTEFRAVRAVVSDIGVLLVMLTAASVGTLAVAGEYATGSARATFAAVPARRHVVAAKAVVVTAVMLAYGAALVGTSFAVTQSILAEHHIDAALYDSGVLRALAASVLMAPVCGLVGMAVGALVRGTASALVTVVIVLILLPMAFDDDKASWSTALDHAQPLSAWERLVMVGPPPGWGWSTAGFAEAWTVFALWAAISAAVAVVAVDRRDV
ncbi:MAG TPA: ABC transporter permease [Yinghuangia sp.]|uniref:ABC transporter permease n=1 Tax=Yinghuangia sp. YIM S10712 TaxID=3436930 RepID=UPI002C429AC0|nr:ABC transporter permease [Yinghuangia sp.]